MEAIIQFVLWVVDAFEWLYKQVRKIIKAINKAIKDLEYWINYCIDLINTVGSEVDRYISIGINYIEYGINVALGAIKSVIDSVIDWVKRKYDNVCNKIKIRILRRTLIKLGTPSTDPSLSDDALQPIAEATPHPDITSYIPEFNLEISLPDFALFGTFSYVTLPIIPLPPPINEEEEDYDTYMVKLGKMKNEEKEAEDKEKSDEEKAADDAYEAYELNEKAKQDLKNAKSKYIGNATDEDDLLNIGGAMGEYNKAKLEKDNAKDKYDKAKEDYKKNKNDDTKLARDNAEMEYDKAKENADKAKEKMESAKTEYKRVKKEADKYKKQFDKANEKAKEYEKNKNINYVNYEDWKQNAYKSETENMPSGNLADISNNQLANLVTEANVENIKVKIPQPDMKASIVTSTENKNKSDNTAGSAVNAGSAGNAGSAVNAGSAGNAGSAVNAGSAGNAEARRKFNYTTSSNQYVVDKNSGSLRDVNFDIHYDTAIIVSDIELVDLSTKDKVDMHNYKYSELSNEPQLVLDEEATLGLYLIINKEHAGKRLKTFICDEDGYHVIFQQSYNVANKNNMDLLSIKKMLIKNAEENTSPTIKRKDSNSKK